MKPQPKTSDPAILYRLVREFDIDQGREMPTARADMLRIIKTVYDQVHGRGGLVPVNDSLPKKQTYKIAKRVYQAGINFYKKLDKVLKEEEVELFGALRLLEITLPKHYHGLSEEERQDDLEIRAERLAIILEHFKITDSNNPNADLRRDLPGYMLEHIEDTFGYTLEEMFRP